MPGPGSRSKAKSKKGQNRERVWFDLNFPISGVDADADEVYVVKIDNAEGWDMIVNILCDYFQLPRCFKIPLTCLFNGR